MSQTSHEVFISYASADKAAADRIRETLEKALLSCWIADRDIEAGTIFPATIVEAVNAARVVVLILTEHSASSPHVLSEIGHAFNQKKPIVPFRLSNVELPPDLDYYVSLTQWLDASGGLTDENLGRLVESTREALAGRRAPWRAGTSRGRFFRIGGVSLALVIVAGGVYWKWPGPAASVSDAGAPAIHDDAAPPKTRVNPEDGQTYAWIPPGTFTMGCSPADDQCGDDEKPAHQVRIAKGFWLGQNEVTVNAYGKYAAKHGRKPPAGDGALPVTEVTRADAKEYCAAVGGRLPTEAEWEYAARGGSTQTYYGILPEIAWYAENSDGTRHPVGTKAPNAFGLHDMLGNVSEWVLDRYYNKYDLASPAAGEGVEEPRAPNASGTIRGGFFDGDAASVRLSHRAEMEPDAAEAIIGFRCASDHPADR